MNLAHFVYSGPQLSWTLVCYWVLAYY